MIVEWWPQRDGCKTLVLVPDTKNEAFALGQLYEQMTRDGVRATIPVCDEDDDRRLIITFPQAKQ